MTTILLLCTGYGLAQDVQDTTALQAVVENADNQVYDFSGIDTLYLLNGNVRVRVDSTQIYCDTARIQNNQILAYGEVAILRHDTIKLFSDSLKYVGAVHPMAYVKKNVVIQSGTGTLYTSSARYDIDNDVASYTDTAMITNGQYKIKSKIGRLYTVTNDIELRHLVTIEGEGTYMKTDSLNYNTSTGLAVFLSPLYMEQYDKKIYAARGTYNTNTQYGSLKDGVEIKGDDLSVSADKLEIIEGGKMYKMYGDVYFKDASSSGYSDTLIYDTEIEKVFFSGDVDILQEDGTTVKGHRVVLDRTTDDIEAQNTTLTIDTYAVTGDQIIRNTKSNTVRLDGHVSVVDTVQNIYILGSQGTYNSDNKSFVLTDSTHRALFMSVSEGDTLYMLADTLFMEQQKDSSDAQNFYAYRNVSVLGSTFSAKSDSIYFDGVDSTFVLYEDPIMWGDSSQFRADTISLMLAQGKISQIELTSQALITSSEDMELFSTIASRNSEVLFAQDTIRESRFIDDVDVRYFLKDEAGYLGLNQSKGLKMKTYFEKGKLSTLHFDGKQDSEIIPMKELTANHLSYGGSTWRGDEKPLHLLLESYRERIRHILSKK